MMTLEDYKKSFKTISTFEMSKLSSINVKLVFQNKNLKKKNK